MRQLNWRRWRPFHRFVAYATLNGAWVVGAACKCPAADSPTIENEFLRVSATDAHGGFSIVPKPSAKGVTVSGQLASIDGNAATTNVSDAIFGSGHSLQWDNARIVVFPKLPFALIRETLKNDTSKAAVHNKIEFASLNVTLPSPVSDLKILGTGGLSAADKNSGSYAWLVVAEPKSRNAVVAGWLTCDRGSGVLFSEADSNAIAIKARSDYGRLHLAPGAETETETLAIGYFDDGRLGLEAWADAVAKTYHIKLPEQPSGFCTWYAEKHGGAADEKSLAELAEFAAKKLKPFGFEFVQIDDKWQQGDSKKNGPNKNFTAFKSPGPYSKGMKPIADKIKEFGLRPGIWFMPFAGTYNDPWFENHRDWFVKKEAGKPYDVSWGGTSLDMTKPEAREYLRGIVKQIAHDWGFTYFKMDGLYTGMAINPKYPNSGYKDDDFGDAVFADPNKTNVEVYRDGLKLVREAAGPDVFFLGCNVAQNMRTYAASFGLLDAMRVGPDNSGSWNGTPTKKGGWVGRSPKLGSLHYFLNGRVWYNDPDPNYVRSSIDLEDARTIASWSAICGALNSNSDWMPDLPEERVELLRRTIAPHGRTARPVDYFENDPPEIWQVTDEKGSPRRDVIALFNWTEEDKKFDIPLSRFDLPNADKYAAFDFWKKESLPPLTNRLQTTLPKHGCQIMAIRPLSDQPFVISTSRHVSQGMIDLIDEKWDESAKILSAKSKVVRGDPYELWVEIPFLTKRLPSAYVSNEDAEAGTKIVFKGDNRLVITSPTNREVTWKLKF